MPSPSRTPVTGSIDLGVSLTSGAVSVYFARAGERLDISTNETRWTRYEKAQALAALDSYAAVANLTFTVTDSADGATFKLTKATSEHGALGFMNPPDPAFGATQGIAWFNTYHYWGGARSGLLDPGSYTYTIFLHEFGHGLGLAHPFDGSGQNVMPQVGTGLGLDQGIYTVMTYNDGWPEAPEGLPDSRAWGWNLGPSAIDIAVIQEKYGANMDTATGDTRYVLPDQNGAGTGYLTIWDAGGVDRLVQSGAGAAVIDLRAATLQAEPGGGGYVSHVAGIHGGFTIAHGVVIEAAIGGGGDDTIIGNATANRLSGRAGNDTIEGNGGADTILGGAGADRLLGGRGDDTLQGGTGRDRLNGQAGDDVLDGGVGRDRLTGGAGADTFVLAPGGGRDRITDFGADDLLDLRAFGLSSAADVSFADQGTALKVGFGNSFALVWLEGIDAIQDHMILI
jgi:serralysin